MPVQDCTVYSLQFETNVLQPHLTYYRLTLIPVLCNISNENRLHTTFYTCQGWITATGMQESSSNMKLPLRL